MGGEQPPSRWRHWRQAAATLAPTLLGLALIVTALEQPAVQSWLPDARRPGDVASARGFRPTSSPSLAPEEEASGSGAEVLSLTFETPAAPASVALDSSTQTYSAALGIGGPVETPPPLETQVISPTVATAPTAIPPRTEVLVYKVVAGDNVWVISQRYGISQDTIIWANGPLELDPDLLSIGQELVILPVTGVLHAVQGGETLAGVAVRYKVDVKKIIDYAPNHLSPGAEPAAGQKLIIPDGIKPFEAHVVYTEGGAVTVNARPEPGRFIWPCNGVITQPFSSRYHLAIDIGNAEGTPLYAADAGTVTLAEAAGTLGNAVSINHGNGYTTTYGHLSTIMVKAGQYVQRGQQIGLMGSTGKSTGPHVHFIVTYYGGAVNPVRYLPALK